MTEKLRVGVIGLGGAGQAHIRGLLAQDDVVIGALADTSEAQLEIVGEKYGVEARHTDYRDLLARDDIDAITTATPNFLHESIVVGAMEHGKHALTEKPLAHTLASAERMVAAAKQHGRVLRMVFNQRCYSDVAVLKHYIDVGEIGHIYHAKAHWMRRQGIPGGGGWFSRRELSGGGPLIDLGVHVLDMALYLMDEPEPVSVSAAAYAEHGRRGQGYRGGVASIDAQHDVEDYLTALIRMKSGQTISLDVSWATFSRFGDDFGVAVYGADGGGEIDVRRYDRRHSLTLFKDVAGTPATIVPELAEGLGYTQVMRDFVDTVRSGEWEGHHGEEALKRSQIVDACYRSAEQGREIRLDET